MKLNYDGKNSEKNTETSSENQVYYTELLFVWKHTNITQTNGNIQTNIT